MIAFFQENLGTILTGAFLAGIVTAIVVKMVRDKRKGKMIGCACGCGGCPKAGACHTKAGEKSALP